MVSQAFPRAFLGVDWDGSEHQLCAVDTDGQILIRRRVHHSTGGMDALDEALADLQTTGPVICAIERGEGLLVEHLQDTSVPVFCISPKISARARERYRLANTKSDEFDAFVLADTFVMNTSTGVRCRYPVKARAVRMVEQRPEEETEWAAMQRVAPLLGIGSSETLRKWVRRSQVDAGAREGTTSSESEELRRLRREVAELKRANAILKAASSFFAA